MTPNNLRQLSQLASIPVDCAGAIFFRVAFGFTCAFWAWDYLTTGRVTRLYVNPQMHFKYPWMEMVQPLPENGMYLLFVGFLALSVLVALGWYYRVAATCFSILFGYFFLLERTNYQNHYYLVWLVSAWMPFLPLNQSYSVDSRVGRVVNELHLPIWVYWILQFHIALPYVYGGIAKLNPDWLLGQPMQNFLASKSNLPMIGTWLGAPNAGVLFSIGGLIFDLTIVPLLLWKRTRILAYLFAIGFHVTNAILFQIHIFPWFMILATTIFFAPNWPRWLLSTSATSSTLPDRTPYSSLPTWKVLAAALLVMFHCVWPLRGIALESQSSWTERDHLFSWRMMLRAKEVGLGFAILDVATGKVANVDHQQFLDEEQAEKFARDPELIRQMAKFIADKFERDTKRRPEVHVIALASLNGRKPQLMIDPNVDLGNEPYSFWETPKWIIPLKEPLRQPAWDIPISQWKQHVELPKFAFLDRVTSDKQNHNTSSNP